MRPKALTAALNRIRRVRVRCIYEDAMGWLPTRVRVHEQRGAETAGRIRELEERVRTAPINVALS